MMKHLLVAVVFILMLIPAQLTGCKPAEKTGEPAVTTSNESGEAIIPEEYQRTVDAIKAMQPSDVPEHLMQESANKTGTEFDINNYFTVLSHLSMEKGYVLDYVYMYDFMGGRPIIYVRQETQKPYLNFEGYYNDAQEVERIEDTYDFVSLLMYGEQGAFENKIRIDGTKEGFFEYTVLQMLGGQFYLAWHANYDDAVILCDPNKIDDIVEATQDWGLQEIPPDIIQKARSLDYKPVIEIKNDTVEVTLIYFTKWGGFTEITFTIKRDYPHTIVNIESKTLIEYKCGIMF